MAETVSLQFYAHSTFHFLVAFSNSVYRQFNAAFSALRSYLLHLARLQFMVYFNQSITFIIPVLLTFLQLKYQGKSLFATHPRTMCVAVSSSLVYYLAYIAVLRRRFSAIAHHCLVSSGYASVASLASVLLPESFSRFVYAFFGLLSATELLYWLYNQMAAEEDVEAWIRRRWICRFLNNIGRGTVGSSSGRWLHRLPI